MAEVAAKKKAEAGGQVVPMSGRQVPAALANLLEETAGQGISTAQEDNLIPLIYVLQAQSPQALKRNPSYIDPAEAGCIWLRNAADPIVNGDDGILFQPCFFSKDVVEWQPERGGFVGRHDFQPGEDMEKFAARVGAKRVTDPKSPNSFKHVLPSGNELVETRYYTGYVLREDRALAEGEAPYHAIRGLAPFVIPLSSTGHTFGRMWMSKMGQKLTMSGKPAANYSHIYRLKTVFRTNASGDWYMFDVDDGVPVWVFYKEDQSDLRPESYTEADIQRANDAIVRGRDLAAAFESGAKKAEMPEAAAEPSGGAGADTTHAEAVV